MKNLTPVTAVLLVPCFLALSLRCDRLEFSPAEGSTVTRTFAQEWEMTLDRMQILFNGGDSGLGEFKLDVSSCQTLVVVDSYGAIEGGRPLSLERTFEAISREMAIDRGFAVGNRYSQTPTQKVTGRSELTGTTVLFAWDEEEYTKAFHKADKCYDERLLEGLIEDMDLRFLMPTEAVAVGDEWDLELSSLPDLLVPGGYLSWDIKVDGVDTTIGSGPDPTMMGDMRRMLGDMLEGSASAKYIREEDGIAVLEIDIEVNSAEDLTDPATRIIGDVYERPSLDIDRLDFEFTLELQGTVHWDVEAGRLSGLELAGELTFTMSLTVLLDWIDPMAIDICMAMSGVIEQGIECKGE